MEIKNFKGRASALATDADVLKIIVGGRTYVVTKTKE